MLAPAGEDYINFVIFEETTVSKTDRADLQSVR